MPLFLWLVLQRGRARCPRLRASCPFWLKRQGRELLSGSSFFYPLLHLEIIWRVACEYLIAYFRSGRILQVLRLNSFPGLQPHPSSPGLTLSPGTMPLSLGRNKGTIPLHVTQEVLRHYLRVRKVYPKRKHASAWTNSDLTGFLSPKSRTSSCVSSSISTMSLYTFCSSPPSLPLSLVTGSTPG